MATIIQQTNSIGEGTQIAFGAGDNVAILPDVVVASTDAGAIEGFVGNNKLRVDGTVIAEGTAVFLSAGNNEITIGSQGRVVSNIVGTSGTAIGLGTNSADGGSLLTNFGEISAPGRIAVLAPRADIVNHGSVDGVSPMFLGVFGRAGATLTNTGTISAVGEGDDVGLRYKNAVYFEGDNGLVTNTGTISASFAGGAGVRFGGGDGTGGASGRVYNSGEILSLAGVGIDASQIQDGPRGVTIVNSGLITGGTSAVLGSKFTDNVTNLGDVFGNVSLANGNDRYTGKGDAEVTGAIRGGGGDDTIVGSDAADRIQGGNGLELIRGGKGDDDIDGEAGNDTIKGGAGDDTLNGGGANDSLNGGAGDDNLAGIIGNDRMGGGSGDDTLTGGDGKDTLRGGTGDDNLNGGGQADRLDGGRGDDTLVSGGGADVFVLAPGGGRDVAIDYVDGTDRIDVTAYGLAGIGELNSQFSLEAIADGVRIDTGSEVLILQGAVLADINGADFLF